MIIKSKIKAMLCDELLRDIAAVCDTMRFNSSHHKMLIIQQLLRKYNVPYIVLGGATNRFVMMIDQYTFKFAIDHQGYVDNLVEYSICRELQPYVTKAFETNGYVLVAECVKVMSLSDFKLRESDIKRVLSTLAQDYLLGDVGYITKNYENWGIRDDGSVVILDYAYCHRGTEKLFTCEVCGCGVLRYDSTYSYLKCSNTADCTATFEYIDRKRIQGDQVDLDMIEEAKSESIHLGRGVSEKEVSDNNGRLTSGTVRVITTYNEYIEYLNKEANKMSNFDTERAFDLMTEKMNTTDPKRLAEIEEELNDIYAESQPDNEEEVIYEPLDHIDIDAEMAEDDQVEEQVDYETTDIDDAMSMDDLVAIAAGNTTVEAIEKVMDTDTTVCEEEAELTDVDIALSMDELVEQAAKANNMEVVIESIPAPAVMPSEPIRQNTEMPVIQEDVVKTTSEEPSVEVEEPATENTQINVEELSKAMSGETSADEGGVFLNGNRI